MNAGIITAIVLGGLLFLFLLILFILLPKKAYFTALFSGAYVSVFKCISMKLRKIDVMEIISAYALSIKSHLGINLYDFEVIATSGGHPLKIVEGLNAVQSAQLKIDFDFLKAIDIAGIEVLSVVRECINPKVIELPLINAVAQDNIEINAKVSLTLKIQIDKFLSGVTDETLSARAVEAVVTKIANTEKAEFLISKPQLIDKAIFDAHIDDDSKYELVSADVIHVDFGVNRNLAAQKEQIEKEHLIASNNLEHRKLIAAALEQENKAKAEELRLKVVEQEAEIPKAIVEAIKEGKMKDVVDYFKLQNLQADTEMRRKFMKQPSRKNDEIE